MGLFSTLISPQGGSLFDDHFQSVLTPITNSMRHVRSRIARITAGQLTGPRDPVDPESHWTRPDDLTSSSLSPCSISLFLHNLGVKTRRGLRAGVIGRLPSRASDLGPDRQTPFVQSESSRPRIPPLQGGESWRRPVQAGRRVRNAPRRPPIQQSDPRPRRWPCRFCRTRDPWRPLSRRGRSRS